MKAKYVIGLLLVLTSGYTNAFGQESNRVVVLGGGASGVAASVQAARQGANVVLVESTDWLGGMLTSAGVSAIDGNYHMPSGFFGEFRDSLVSHYGSLQKLKTGWVSNVLFEPSVGNRILKKIVHAESRIDVRYNSEVQKVQRKGEHYQVSIRAKNGKTETIEAKVLIDATELGDVAAELGVPYDVGMESRKDTDESIAPLEGNDIIQDLTYVAILKDYGRDMTMEMPEGYDPEEFACCCINDHCVNPKEPHRMWSKDKMITYGRLPNDKYMINWPIEGNDFFVNIIEISDDQREEALRAAKAFTMKFIYFIQHELGYTNLYLADDEFPTEDHLPLIPYHRESRRIHGEVRFTLNDIVAPYDQQNPLYRTGIAVGDYPVDHHHARYTGWGDLPDLYFYPVPSFGLPMGTLLPADTDNLIVAEKSISVSNLVNGTTRLQPVVLQIGQAAGAMAALSLTKNISVGEVAVRDVQNELLESSCYLLPYLDVDLNHPWFKPLQRIGATGILKGVGKNVDWSNQTWLYADSLLYSDQLNGLNDFYSDLNYKIVSDQVILWSEAFCIVESIAKTEGLKVSRKSKKRILAQLNKSTDYKGDDPISRGEFAVLVDGLLDPFNDRHIDIKGRFLPL